MRAVTKAGLIAAAAGALAACDPYYMDPQPYPGPAPGYPGDAYPGPGYPGPGHTPRPGEFVETIGCVVPGVENRCTILRDNQGRTWNMTGPQAPPPAYSEWAVRVRGRAAANMASYCMQGMVLSEARWEYTNLRCREGRVQGYQGY